MLRHRNNFCNLKIGREPLRVRGLSEALTEVWNVLRFRKFDAHIMAFFDETNGRRKRSRSKNAVVG